MFKRKLFVVTAIFAVLVSSMVLTACGGAAATETPAPTEAPAATGAPAETAVSLTGITWKLTAFGPVGSPSPVVVDSKGTITFGADGKLTGIGACNQFESNYEVKGNQITISHITWGVGGNKSCPEPQMSQESGVWEVLRGTVEFKIEDNTLTIKRIATPQYVIFLVFEAVAGE